MSGTNVLDEIELVVEDIGHGGGGGKPPDRDDHRGGGGDDGNNSRPRRPEFISIQPAPLSDRHPSWDGFDLHVLHGAVRRLPGAQDGQGLDQFPLPAIIWINTIVLLTSSLTIDLARRRLALNDYMGFKTMWRATTALGVAFLVGQVVAWRELVAMGFYVGTNPRAAFSTSSRQPTPPT